MKCHLFWCALSSHTPEEKKEKWLAYVGHLQNVHNCSHPPITRNNRTKIHAPVWAILVKKNMNRLTSLIGNRPKSSVRQWNPRASRKFRSTIRHLGRGEQSFCDCTCISNHLSPNPPKISQSYFITFFHQGKNAFNRTVLYKKILPTKPAYMSIKHDWTNLLSFHGLPLWGLLAVDKPA